LVNRKIVADTTGGWGRHGGGGLNGKDFSKTDRSGVYVARYAAKNIVAAGLADQVEIQIGYAIGQARPVSVYANTFGTEHVSLDSIQEVVNDYFDFRPLAIIDQLRPSPEAYKHTALFGHLGRNPGGLFLWENLDKVDELQKLIHS
jgi:S-adenosylmethionine synthetase